MTGTYLIIDRNWLIEKVEFLQDPLVPLVVLFAQPLQFLQIIKVIKINNIVVDTYWFQCGPGSRALMTKT